MPHLRLQVLKLPLKLIFTPRTQPRHPVSQIIHLCVPQKLPDVLDHRFSVLNLLPDLHAVRAVLVDPLGIVEDELAWYLVAGFVAGGNFAVAAWAEVGGYDAHREDNKFRSSIPVLFQRCSLLVPWADMAVLL